MLRETHKARNIVSILAICDALTQKELREYKVIEALINTKAYQKTTFTPLLWAAYDEMMQSLGERAENPLEDEVILKEIIKTKFLFKRFLQQIDKEVKALKKKALELLLELHKAKEDKAFQIKEILSQLTTFLQLQKEHDFIDKNILLQTTYYKTLTKRP